MEKHWFHAFSKDPGGGPKIAVIRQLEVSHPVQGPHSLFQIAQARIQETTWSKQDTGIKEQKNVNAMIKVYMGHTKQDANDPVQPGCHSIKGPADLLDCLP